MRYPLRVPDELSLFIRKLHPHLKTNIRVSLDTIVCNPYSGKELRQGLAGLRSFRVGRYRIIYKILNQQIEIVAIGPRKNIYLETYRLLKKN